VAKPRAFDPGGLGMPLYMRNYGRAGVSLFGLLLVALFFVPLALDAQSKPVFYWDYASVGLPAEALTVAIVLLGVGAIAMFSGMFLRGVVLGGVSFACGVGAALTWFFLMRSNLGALGGQVRAADICMLIGLPVAMIGLRLRTIFERGVMGRLWLVPGLVLLVLACVLPVAGQLPAVASLKNIKASPEAGLYIGAGVAIVFGLISLLPSAGGAAMLGFTGLILGVLSPFVRGMIEQLVSMITRVHEANAQMQAMGQDATASLEFSQVLNQVLLPLGIPMLRILGLLMLVVLGGVLLFGAVTLRPKSAEIPMTDGGG
jgi:hypothetical protein